MWLIGKVTLGGILVTGRHDMMGPDDWRQVISTGSVIVLSHKTDTVLPTSTSC